MFVEATLAERLLVTADSVERERNMGILHEAMKVIV